MNSSAEEPRPLTFSWFSWLLYWLAGVIWPVFCFGFAWAWDLGTTRVVGVTWQSGQPRDYAWLLYFGDGAQAFYPLLAYSIVSLALVLKRPQRFADHFFVRLGVYGGVLLAAQYCVVLILALPIGGGSTILGRLASGLLGVGATSLVCGMLWALQASSRKFTARATLGCVGVLVSGGLLISAVFFGAEETLRATIELPLSLGLWLAPFWTLAVYLIVSIRLWRRAPSRFGLGLLFGAITWLSAYAASWRWAVTRTLEQYASLPTTQPQGCYVCTAAAAGHPRLVRSERLSTSDGRPVMVNDQMRYLKCAELILLATSPRTHLTLRRIYDWLGPRLARRIHRPLAADLAYLALKPAEWAVRIIFTLFCPRLNRLADRLYRR